MWAIFSSSFTQYLEDFVDIVIVWIAPLERHLPDGLDPASVPLRPERAAEDGARLAVLAQGRRVLAGIVAQVVGMFAAISALSATFHLPHWLNQVTYHTRDAFGFGGDFSIFLGIGVGALVYLILATRSVRKQADAQEQLLREEALLPVG